MFQPIGTSKPFQAARGAVVYADSTLFSRGPARLSGGPGLRVIPLQARQTGRRPVIAPFQGVDEKAVFAESPMYYGADQALWRAAVSHQQKAPVMSAFTHKADNANFDQFAQPMPDSGEVMGGTWTPEVSPVSAPASAVGGSRRTRAYRDHRSVSRNHTR
jgi:hypothetical protein